MIDRIASHDARIIKVEGPTASGKTEALIQRCLKLIERGSAPESILVATPTRNAATFFRHRLVRAAKPDSKDAVLRIQVARALDVCTTILDKPAAREETGRIPRILTESEYVFLLEDLKTLGQKNQRLRNMLSFFYAQWSALKKEEDWVIPGEESMVLGRMRDIMRLQGTMLRDEAPYICAQVLESPSGSALTQHFDYVFCDDFQSLSYAEQTCMCLCARKQLIVCGNAAHATQANTKYPHPKGFDLFDRTRRGVDVFSLEHSFGPAEAVHISESLDAVSYPKTLTSADSDTSSTSTLFVEWPTPEEEMNSFARIADAWIKHKENAYLSDICIAVPTKRWGLLAYKALKTRGIPVSDAGLYLGLGGDPRIEGHHEALSAYARLLLAADGQDMTAWRIWGGLDHALTNSDIWRHIYDNALETTTPLYDVFKEMATNPSQYAHDVFRSKALEGIWTTGQDVITRTSNLKGSELAQATGISDIPSLMPIIANIDPNDDASSLREKVRNHLLGPSFIPNDGKVRIAMLEATEGMECSCLILPGLVNGLLPHRDAFDPVKSDAEHARAIDTDRVRLAACLPRGVQCLIASSFSSADIETAEKSKMKVERIVSAKGERTALLTRSIFLTAGEQLQFIPGDEQVITDFIANISQTC